MNTELEITKLKVIVEAQTQLIGKLNKRVLALEKKLEMAGAPSDTQINSPEQAPQTTNLPVQIPQNKSPMLEEYNALSFQEDFESRGNFARKYKVRALTCANADARLNNASLPLEFTEAASVESGEYWAISAKKENLYFVLPNVKVYTANLHSVRAMGRVFKSNFEVGNVYNKIFIEQPAIFVLTGNAWKIVEPGRLKLE